MVRIFYLTVTLLQRCAATGHCPYRSDLLELPGSRICDPEAASLLLDHVRYLKDWIENKAHYSEPGRRRRRWLKLPPPK